MSRSPFRYSSILIAAISLVALPIAGARSDAQSDSLQQPARPFVAHRVALQLSDRFEEKQALILSMANKMLETYGPDSIDIQVVAIGPGIDLLRLDNPNRTRVDSLIAQGVTFNVCGNTLDTMERRTGDRPTINPKAVEVSAGGPFLLSLTERQYTIIRP